MQPKLNIPKFELSVFKRFIYTFKKTISIAYKVNPKFLVLILLINSFWGLTNLPVLYINKILIDTIIANIGNPNLEAATYTLIILIVIRALIEFLRSSLSRINDNLNSTFSEQVVGYLERMGGIKLNSLDIPTLESPDFQDRYKKIEREGNNRLWGMLRTVSDFPNAIFTLISGIVPVFAFNPVIAFWVVLVTLPEVLVNTRLARKDYESVTFLSPKWRVWGWILWHMTDAKNYYENKILGTNNYLAKRLEEVQKEILKHNHARRMKRVTFQILSGIPGNLLSIGLNVYFFALALLGKISLGSAQLLFQSTNTLALGFSSLFDNVTKTYENYLFVSEVSWLLELKSQIQTGTKSVDKVFAKGIEFKDVWFRYPNSKNWILKGINFSIGPKENLALVGENGAGKTTLIKLLSGFYLPTKGEILVNGINIADYNQTKYRKNLGVLFQDFSWYPFSAKESIGIGDSTRINNLEEIKKVANLTGINKFIEGLPFGYDNPLAKEFDKGVEPSKGQWQRIALSRVLFRKAKIIVLDEPTSNVDPEAEEEIFEKIINLAREKILVLISHRFSTVRKADKILLVDGGVIKEQGNHEELMKLDGEYTHLFHLQAKGYK